jgi:hypothetical protein
MNVYGSGDYRYLEMGLARPHDKREHGIPICSGPLNAVSPHHISMVKSGACLST